MVGAKWRKGERVGLEVREYWRAGRSGGNERVGKRKGRGGSISGKRVGLTVKGGKPRWERKRKLLGHLQRGEMGRRGGWGRRENKRAFGSAHSYREGAFRERRRKRWDTRGEAWAGGGEG